MVVVFLVWDHCQRLVKDPLDSEHFQDLKGQLAALKSQPISGEVDKEIQKTARAIQEEDFRLRHEYFRQRQFGAYGAWLLLGEGGFPDIGPVGFGPSKKAPGSQAAFGEEPARSPAPSLVVLDPGWVMGFAGSCPGYPFLMEKRGALPGFSGSQFRRPFCRGDGLEVAPPPAGPPGNSPGGGLGSPPCR